MLGVGGKQRGFVAQALFAFGEHGRGFETAEIEFVDDGQNVDFKEHRLNHRPFDADVETVFVVDMHVHEAAFELEEFEIIDKVAFDKAQAAQVVQLVGAKLQAAQIVEFALEVVADFGERIDGLVVVAAAEFVNAVGFGKLVQHHLQHGEFVKVGIEQGADYRHKDWDVADKAQLKHVCAALCGKSQGCGAAAAL